MVSHDLPPTLVREEMRYWLLRPDPRLRPHVRMYFVVDAVRRQAVKEELLLPDGYAELIFLIRSGFKRQGIGGDAAASMKRSYLIGGRSHSIVTQDVGDLRVIGVKLDPRLLHRFIRVPLSEFRDSTLEFRDLNDVRLLDLEDQIAECSRAADVAQVLDRFFLKQLAAEMPREPLVDHVLNEIHREHGAGSITGWARDLGVDTRTLERKFLAWTGMTPKTYARIVRFKHSYHQLITLGGRNVRLAQACLDGYYDQSHFYKDFKYFTGTSPSAIIAERVRCSTAVTNHLLEQDLSAA